MVVTYSTASSVFIGTDNNTKSQWRSTNVAKPLDIGGDNAYGTDGYFAVDPTGAPVTVNPSYGTMANVPGGLNAADPALGAYTAMDDLSGIAATVPNTTANPAYIYPVANGAEFNLATFTLNQAKTFRMAILGDIRADNLNQYNSTHFRVRGPGGADSGLISMNRDGSGGDWLIFELSGVNGDVFTISGVSSGSEVDLTRVGLDSLAPPPLPLAITSTIYDANNAQLKLTWNSTPGSLYTIQNTQRFEGNGAASWDNLTTGIVSGGFTTTAVIDSPQPGTYYRIRKQ